MEEKNTKILLVEDDIMIRDMYEQGFRLMGYHIETAVDGQDAVDKLEKMDQLPVLIMLDIMMPRMTGYDVLNYIKNSQKFKNILIVMLTSLHDREVAEKSLKLGAVGYLVKGEQNPKEVVAIIEKFIAEHSEK